MSPLFDHACQTCHHVVEVLVRNGDPDVIPCPACGGVTARLACAPAVQFKGSGWAADGYAGTG